MGTKSGRWPGTVMGGSNVSLRLYEALQGLNQREVQGEDDAYRYYLGTSAHTHHDSF